MINQASSTLTELADFLHECHDELYSCRSQGIHSSIGAHTRHLLNHFDALIDGFARQRINYALRQRDTNLENSTELALSKITSLQQKLAQINEEDLDSRLLVVLEDGSSIAESTLSRELSFIMNHSIHHYAIIKIIAEQLGKAMPATFGMSPSTIEYLENASDLCAR